MASPTVAANAYANLARILDTGGAGKGPEAGGGSSFGALLKDALGSVLEAGKKSDAQTVAMASGKANVMDVVTAVGETDALFVPAVRHETPMVCNVLLIKHLSPVTFVTVQFPSFPSLVIFATAVWSRG